MAKNAQYHAARDTSRLLRDLLLASFADMDSLDLFIASILVFECQLGFCLRFKR